MQFVNVDVSYIIVELDKTEDIDNLDKRRMEIGMKCLSKCIKIYA